MFARLTIQYVKCLYSDSYSVDIPAKGSGIVKNAQGIE